MARLTGESLYLVREVGTEYYLSGYQKYAVPKLYTKGPASATRNRKNKEAVELNSPRRYEVVPVVEFKLGDPI